VSRSGRTNSFVFLIGWIAGLAIAGWIVIQIGLKSSEGEESDLSGWIRIVMAVGVPEGAAFGAALTHRMVTSDFPPVAGWYANRWLIRNDYL
jgi:hypothetical protein